MPPFNARILLFALFTVSGFSGLIYESVWSHYLKLFLGHAAYAQSLVLVIFMGGMALGSWFAGRRSRNWRNLLLAYAVVEGVIGLAGLVFHRVFDASITGAHEFVLPWLAEPWLAHTFKWGFSAALVFPQSVLLGMTFPLMSAALVRRYPDDSGRSLAMLYFTNSIGAAIGVLASGFVLMPAVGLPGTILSAGILNLVLALLVWAVAKGDAWSRTGILEPAPSPAASASRPALLLLVALVTGAASFIYEIGWIRLLSLVLGASTHAFELMLSAFILGLALGSLWVRGRIQRLGAPIRFLGQVQIAMGMLALASLVVYGSTFEVMSWLVQGTAKNDAGYGLFNVGSHAIALLVMLPATFCAGTTLPLITHELVRAGRGERSIGEVYAANTFGAILGVLVAVHVGMPVLGLKGLVVLGAGLDVAAGAALLLLYSRSRPARSWAAVGAGVTAIVATLALVHLDPFRMSSGVFRKGDVDRRNKANTEIVYNHDGKTATVSLLRFPDLGIISLLTNGKPDASAQTLPGKPPRRDEYTMVLLGALPLAIRPQARTAAVVGFGSGVTTHVLLSSPALERVDTIEIEPRMVEASTAFRPRSDRAYDDPRSQIHIEDARTFFSARQGRYDIIISEPSNPWVSGVASLFTEQFYGFVSRHLTQRGIFAQWVHAYDLTPELLSTIVLALASTFQEFTIYNMNDWDMLIVASVDDPDLAPDTRFLFGNRDSALELEAVEIEGPQDIRVRYVGNARMLAPFFAGYRTQANSDYFPLLDLGAVRARFLGAQATELLGLRRAPLPVVEMLDPLRAMEGSDPPNRSTHLRASRVRVDAVAFARALGDDGARAGLSPAAARLLAQVKLAWASCGRSPNQPLWIDLTERVTRSILAFAPAAELTALWQQLDGPGCASTWTDRQRHWVTLARAISERDPKAMTFSADALLAMEDAPTESRRAFLLGASMLGDIASGRPENAALTWQKHSSARAGSAWPIEVRVLAAIAAGSSPAAD